MISGDATRTHRRRAVSHKVTALVLMALSLGETGVVIASQPETTAREMLHSVAFADRPVNQSAKQLLSARAIGFAAFGDYGRGLRHIAASHMIAPKRKIAAHGSARLVVVEHMLGAISQDLAKYFGCLQRAILNSMGSVFGRRYETRSPEAIEPNAMVHEGFELLGADHLPALKCLDVQRIHQRCATPVQFTNRSRTQTVHVLSLWLDNGCSDESELAGLPPHPPGSLLSGARLSTQDADHHVPAGTTAMVNMYAITHDPALWAQPESFDPERYLEQDMEVRGNELRLASFSPGRALGLATVLLLAGRSMRLARKMDHEDPDPLSICKPRSKPTPGLPPAVPTAGPRPVYTVGG